MFKHRKNQRKTRWTKAFRKSNGKELTLDPTFEFEKKRNAPPKYSRDLLQKTLKAMRRVEAIRAKRQNHFMQQRFKHANEVEKQTDRNVVRKNLNLIRSPAAGLKKKKQQRVTIVEEMDDEDESLVIEQQDEESESEEEAEMAEV